MGVDGPHTGADHVGAADDLGISSGEHLQTAEVSFVVRADDEVVADEVSRGERGHGGIVPGWGVMCQGKGEGNRERPGPPPFLDRGSEQDEVFALRCVRSVALVVPARPVVRAVLRDAPPVQDEVADDLQDVVVPQVRSPVGGCVELLGLEHRVAAVAEPSVRCRLPLAGVVLQHRPPRVARRVCELHD